MKNVIVSAFDPETGKELKYGEHGEIRIFTPARMNGYFKNEDATNKFFKRNALICHPVLVELLQRLSALCFVTLTAKKEIRIKIGHGIIAFEILGRIA